MDFVTVVKSVVALSLAATLLGVKLTLLCYAFDKLDPSELFDICRFSFERSWLRSDSPRDDRLDSCRFRAELFWEVVPEAGG